MSKRKFQPGQKVGHWTVAFYTAKGRYVCRCVCGTEKSVDVQSLERGKSKSCGCRMVELSLETKAFMRKFLGVA